MADRRTWGEWNISPFNASIRTGLATGTVHGILSVALWTFFGFEGFERMVETEPVFLAYSLLGMFLLGVIPGVFYARWRAIAPALLIGVSLSISAYRTWTVVGEGSTPVDPTPFGWYVLLWVGVAVLATVAGLVERRVIR